MDGILNGGLQAALKEISKNSSRFANYLPELKTKSGQLISEPTLVLQTFSNHFFQQDQLSTLHHQSLEAKNIYLQLFLMGSLLGS